MCKWGTNLSYSGIIKKSIKRVIGLSNQENFNGGNINYGERVKVNSITINHQNQSKFCGVCLGIGETRSMQSAVTINGSVRDLDIRKSCYNCGGSGRV